MQWLMQLFPGSRFKSGINHCIILLLNKNRRSRDLCRRILGQDVVFIVLNLTKNCVEKRLEVRSGGGENSKKSVEIGSKMYDLYEAAGEDEEGAHNITITEDMSTDEVLKLILHKIGK